MGSTTGALVVVVHRAATIQCDKSASAISRGFVGRLRGQILT